MTHKKSSFLCTAALSAVLVASSAHARDLTVIGWGGSYQEAQRKAYFEPIYRRSRPAEGLVLQWRTGQDQGHGRNRRHYLGCRADGSAGTRKCLR